MKSVELVEFIPEGTGRTKIKYIECSECYSNMLKNLTAHNYYFSMETLNTDEIVLYCESTDNDEDIVLQIVKDKKDISSSLELLIDMCYNRFLGSRNST